MRRLPVDHIVDPCIPAAALRGWVASVLEASGVQRADALLAGRELVRANLRGVDSHGISRLPIYARLLRSGTMNPQPDTVVEERLGVVHLHADRGLGQVAGVRAVNEAIGRLQGQASCTVVLHRVGHLGALGVLAAQLADAGMLGLVMQNGPAIMGMPGATAPAIGNNPMAFGAPVRGGPPLVVDIASSQVAFGRIIDAARAGEPLAPGWALDATGTPTQDAAAAMGGMLSPAAGHKGIGLAMMVEMLAGSLSGVRPAAMQGATLPGEFGGFLYALNPALIAAGFAEHVAEWIGIYHGSGPGMRYPGERAAASEARREAEGVPIPARVLADLTTLAAELGLQPLVAA
jgi:LDH2 family malate/lactate/ureidoglycolate dehydrogenase